MKKYLEAKNALMEYACKKARVTMLVCEMALIASIKDSIDDDPSKRGSSEQADSCTCLDVYDEELLDTMRNYVKMGDKVLRLIKMVKGPEVQTVLLGRYLSQMTLEGIAIDMKCSLSKVKHLHREGLRQVQELLDSSSVE